VRTEEEFKAVHKEEQAALLFFARWFHDAVISREYAESLVSRAAAHR
jgi:hypothetical protein